MAQLTRRSKDNATDLISLKEATSTRDEDIRKSLKELTTNLFSGNLSIQQGDHSSRSTSRAGPGTGAYLIDNKPHCDPPAKTFALPRIPSPNTFAATLERELVNSPSPYGLDGAANLALLEKILREMSTKEGQERVLSSFTELASKLEKDSTKTARKLEEVADFIKEKSGSFALVTRPQGQSEFREINNSSANSGDCPPRLELNFETPPRSGPLARATRELTPHASPSLPRPGTGASQAYASPRAADFVSDDILKLLRKLKDSVSENGGMTAEVKALVRELRGEVLGMGREIGRKLDTIDKNDTPRSQGPDREEVARIVEEGLSQLKTHMDQIMRENRRQSNSSSISKSTVDSQEVYHAVKNAMSEMQLSQRFAASAPSNGMVKEDILEAIKDAWESYKPEIELQNFGLEREEILQCLKEGLEEYRPQGQSRDIEGVGREEVLDAVREGLQNFTPPPPPETEASITRDEILVTVRECLEKFPFPAHEQPAPRSDELNRDHVLGAVKEGLSTFDFPTHAPGIGKDVTRDDILFAVREGLEAGPTSLGGTIGEQLLERLDQVVNAMHIEFKGVSDEAKQNVAANGRDTEQVLDAVKDGLEHLRAEIETYVDRAADVTGRDEILDAIRGSSERISNDLRNELENGRGDSAAQSETFHFIKEEFEHLRETLAKNIIKGGDSSSSSEMVDIMREEFEHLRSTLSTSLIRSSGSVDRDEIIEAMKDGLDGIRTDMERIHHNDRPESIISGTGEILDALSDGLDSLRADVEKLVAKPVDMSVSYEILETLKEGMASVRADLDQMREAQANAATTAATAATAEPAVPTTSRELDLGQGEIVVADSLKRNDIENLEVMITQLRIKVESLDGMPQPPPPSSHGGENSVNKDDLTGLEEMLHQVQASIAALAEKERRQDEDSVRKEDMDAVETLLINTKAKIDDILVPIAETSVKREDLDYVEMTVKDIKEIVEDLNVKMGSDIPKQEDVVILGSMVKDMKDSLEEMKERAAREYEDGERATKTDLDAIEGICADTKAQIDQVVLPHLESMPSSSALEALEHLMKEHHETHSTHAKDISTAMEDRRIESETLGEKLTSVREFLEQIKDELKISVEDGTSGVENVAHLVEGLGETLGANANIAAEVKEMMETISREFDRAHGSIEGIKLDSDEKTSVLLQRHDDKNAELLVKLDEGFEDIMVKLEDAQIAADQKQKIFDDKEAMNDDLLAGTRATLEEVKLNTATLGTAFTEVADRMGEDSKTVFTRIEDTYARLESTHSEAKAEHLLTRGEAQKTLALVGSIQDQVQDYHPKILNSVKDILLIVGQHYEQSRKQVEESEVRDRSAAAIEGPPVSAPTVHEMLEREKYDDTEVHSKLDKLINHATAAGKSFAQIDMLDQIHQQVMTTAAEVSEFVAVQARLITEDHESKERQAEEAAIVLEKRLAHQERVECETAALQDQKDELLAEVAALKAERAELANHKMHLTADVSSLETALKIRREELAVMESRAEGLERRILEGVIDHSRALLISRPGKGTSHMSLKRVPSHASTNTATASSLGQSAVSMALKRGGLPPKMNPAGPNTSGRRILSLNQITNNVPSGGNASLAPLVPADRGLGNLKRSQSVKTSLGTGMRGARKTSWGGHSRFDARDKENDPTFQEEGSDGELSDASEGTQRGGGGHSQLGSSVSGARSTSYGTELGTGTMIGGAEGDEYDEEHQGLVKYEGDASSVSGIVDGLDE